MIERKYIAISLIIFTIIFMLIGSTFAFWSWNTTSAQTTNVTFKVTPTFSCSADGGGSITSSQAPLVPTDCTNSTYAIKRKITVNTTVSDDPVALELWLKVNSIGTGLSNSQNFKYALTTSSNSCTTGVVSSGNFIGTKANSKIVILDNEYSATTTEPYYLYIWLDKTETSTSTAKQNFDLSLGGDCNNAVRPMPEAPVLDESGMIPVTISDTGVVKTISKTDSNWYDYKNKQWANVILTTSSSRSKYLGTSGVEVTQSDILAYYVWIPRYKFQIWTTGTSSSGKEQRVEVMFEGKNDAMSLGTTVGSFRTHPAFWWDSDNNGVVDANETLAGIWVGKFETSPGTSSNVGTSNPTILPDVQSWRNQNVSTQFTTSLKFSGGTLTDGIVTYSGNDIYGLSNTTNSHMMKNNEWGAVAYLSHSIYGANREIYINNSSSYYTGRSGGNVGGSTAINTVYTSQTSTSQYNTYGYYTWDGYLLNYNTNTKGTTHDITKVASTTGNITGIYDMSGSAWEHVMGVLADSNGKPRSGYDASSNSGFNGRLYSGTYSEGISFPTSEYYDLYTSTKTSSEDISLSTTACNGGICYGHALSETASWYSDSAYFVSSESPWFKRGDYFRDEAYAGAFHSSISSGYSSEAFSWRSALLVGFGA